MKVSFGSFSLTVLKMQGLCKLLTVKEYEYYSTKYSRTSN